MPSAKPKSRAWPVPLGIAVVTAAALLSALMLDEPVDTLAAISLGCILLHALWSAAGKGSD